MTLPGAVWRIGAEEAHCFLVALEHHQDKFFDTVDADLQTWKIILAGAPTTVAPTDKDPGSDDSGFNDREFFEKLVREELAWLSVYEPFYALACGCTVADHESILEVWLNREIELPKQFASSREALAELPFQERISIENLQQPGLPVEVELTGKPRLSRQDAERIVEEELERYRERLVAGNPEIIRSMVETGRVPPGFDWKKFVDSLNRGHEATLADAERQLRALLEKHIIDREAG